VPVFPADGSVFPFSSGRAVILSQSAREAFSNYPNPFISSREQTRITFYMPSDGRVTLKIYTVTGHLVRTLIESEHRHEGLHQDVTWDGRNGRGNPVLNGVYLLVIETSIGGRESAMKRKVSVLR
jgi:flagellar hook assembly protein FlgD